MPALAEQLLGRRLITKRRQSRKPKVKPTRWPRAARLAYYAELARIVADVERQVKRRIFPLLSQVVSRPDAADIHLDDSAFDEIKRRLAEIRLEAEKKWNVDHATEIAGRVGKKVADFNKREINQQFRAAIGVEPIQYEPYLSGRLQNFVSENVGLIRSIATERLPEVENLVMRGYLKDVRVEDLRNSILQRFSVSRSRAELISRDQVGKLNGQLTEDRQKSVGISEYIWSTSKDERVRKRHIELEGTRHSWNDPPIVDERAGRRAHPGEDFQCRCVAIPVIDPLLEENEAGLSRTAEVELKLEMIAGTPEFDRNADSL